MARKPQGVNVPLRDAQALELRKAGANYDQIARQMGFSNKSGAHHSVMRALKAAMAQRDAVAEDVLELELQRLDAMLVGLWSDAKNGKWLAIDRVLRIMERRAAYLGLDAAKKTEVSGPEGRPIEIDSHVTVSVEERQRRILAIVDAARGRIDLPALTDGADLATAGWAADAGVADAG